MINYSTIVVVACALTSLQCCSSDTPAQMNIAVQKKMSAGCWATMTDEPIASDYPLATSSCADSAPAELLSGSDHVRVIIDYNVDFDENESAPAPTLQLLLDGVETPSAATVQATVNGDPKFALAEFVVPSTPAQELRLSIETPSGYSGAIPTVFLLEPPPITISVAQCPTDSACELLGGTGSAQVNLSIPGTTSQSVTLSSAINGVENSPDLTVNATELGDGVVTANVPVEVPFARDGASWLLTAHLGSGNYPAPPIRLKAPTIESSIGCASPCAVKAGSSIGLTVKAPGEIQATQATVRTYVDGVPALAGVLLNLDGKDVNADQAFGTQLLTAPASGSIWQIDVNVGGYPAQTILANITL